MKLYVLWLYLMEIKFRNVSFKLYGTELQVIAAKEISASY